MKIKHLLISTTLLLASFSYGQYIYTFDNGTANNVSTVVTGLNGTVSGATLMANRFGIPNKAYNLNGTGTINLGDNPYSKGATNFSLCMWVQKPSNTGNKGIFKKGSTFLRTYGSEIYAYNYALNNYGYTNIPTTNTYASIPTNDWFHLAYVLNSGTLNLYINGSLYGTASGVGSLENTMDNLTLGYTDSETSILDGGLDDIFIFNTALTAAEVMNNKNLTLSGSNVSTPTVSGINTSISLSSKNSPIIVSILGSGFSNGASVTLGGVVLSNVSIVGNVLTATIPVNSTVIDPNNPSVIVQNLGGLISNSINIEPRIVYTFESFTYSFNNSPSTIIGTVTGGTMVQDRLNRSNKEAFSLNNSGSINLGAASFMNGATNFSLTMWAQKQADNAKSGFFKKGTTFVRTYNLSYIYAYNYATNAGGYTSFFNAGLYSNLAANEWFHLAYVLEAGSLYLYINGSIYGSVSGVGALGPTTDNLMIGYSDSETSVLRGGVDDVHLFDYALSAAQVLANKNITSSGVNSISTQSANPAKIMTIYPNPSTGTFTIASTQSIGANDIKVYDLVGSSQTFTLSGNELTISKSGIYIVYILGKPIKVVVL